ncbi:alpha/beta fold hydrolase [Aliiroseovarius sp. S1339]|uniref:alpha/beta hydrolase family protein n=1 Tax=Aliiroseovarius sp. S1339 TaxID=2936990 RepID=UPI0020C0E84D|nr:alpha/beta fold hydrolase [Aliiroseovarius sp. S1339]MCK8462427.1 alpha/beta fold hydrolase [Aliiroseovarius sp. S1339]
MWRSLWIFLAAIVILTIFLAIPFVFNDRAVRPLSGASLDQLTYEEVIFQNGGLELAGMLMLPEGDAHSPGAVFIHGSGTSRRDNPWYLSVAEELLANDIAVLIPDKRGSENSSGDWRDTRFEELSSDTEAAFALLTQTPGVDSDRVGLIGFSQGGWIAPIVASEKPSVAFVVSLSGAGVTTEEQLVFEEVNNIAELGTYRFVARLIARFTVPAIMQRDTWRATAGFDPMTYWPGVEAPVFAAFGEGDTNVPVQESVSRFEMLPYEVSVGIYPDGGHGITDPVSGRVQQAFLDDLVSFVLGATDD